MKFEFTFAKGPGINPPTPETPFRILVLGDLDGRTSRNLTQPLADRRPVPVDLDAFEPFLKSLRAEVQLGFSDPATAPIRLAAGGLEDLHPDRLFEQMDLFAALRGLRRRLLEPATFAAAAAEVRAWGGAGTPPPSGAAPTPVPPARESNAGTLERLLGQAPAPAPASVNLAGGLIQQAVAPYIVAAPAGDQPALVAAVDAAAADLMRRVLHDPAFQSLEAAWRGLDFLVRRLDLNESLTVSLLNLSRTELLAGVMGEDGGQSDLFRILVADAVQSPGAEPWALVLGLYDFEPSPADRELLARLAKLARAAGAPFVAAAGAKLWQTVLQNPDQFAADQAWTGLRTSPEAAWLGLTGPRFLLRLPYGQATEPIETFALEEFTGAAGAGDYLWGPPALAFGVLLGQRFAESGWELSPGGNWELGGLPVHSWREGTETRMTPCAESWLKDAAAERLREHGLMPFQSIQGRDAIRLTGAPSLHQPPRELAGRWNLEQ